MITEHGRWMSGYDFDPWVNGAGKEFEHIGSSTIQEVCQQYAVKRRAAKRAKLRWRKSFGERRSLGWVPFKARAAVWRNGQVRFAGQHFKVWDSYGLAGTTFRAGCFAEDARGRWYFCAAVEVEARPAAGQDVIRDRPWIEDRRDVLGRHRVRVARVPRHRSQARHRPTRSEEVPCACVAREGAPSPRRRAAQVLDGARGPVRGDPRRRRVEREAREDDHDQVDARRVVGQPQDEAPVQGPAGRHRLLRSERGAYCRQREDVKPTPAGSTPAGRSSS